MVVKFAAGYKSIFGGDVVHDPSNPNRLKIAHMYPRHLLSATPPQAGSCALVRTEEPKGPPQNH